MLQKCITQMVRNWGTPASSSNQKQRPRRFVPALEDLQARVVPAATVSNGILYIDGTNTADVVIVIRDPNRFRVIDNGINRYFSFASVSRNRVEFRGYGGNDRFVNSTGLLATAYGMQGADVLIGGSNADNFFGGDGNDTLQGGDGNDGLSGENGRDVLWGEKGHDTLVGGFSIAVAEVDGHDYLDGGDGNDELWGTQGNDTVIGGNGFDALYGQAGNDKLYAAFVNSPIQVEGDNYVFGGDGNDTLVGSNGRDLMAGENGSDYLAGEGSDDTLFGAFYNSVNEAGGNQDTL